MAAQPWYQNQDNITMLAHVLGGMGENVSAGNPMFSGVPQSLVKAQNMAQLLNRMGGVKAGTTKGGKPTDNNPSAPEAPADKMKLSFDGTPNDLTNTLMSMSFGGGGSEIVNEALAGVGFTSPTQAPTTSLDPTNLHTRAISNPRSIRSTEDFTDDFSRAIGGLPF